MFYGPQWYLQSETIVLQFFLINPFRQHKR